MRVTPSLDTIDRFEICNPPVESFIQTDPTVMFNGENFLAAWVDEKYGPSNYYHPFVARVSPAGVVLDSGVMVSNASVPEYRPNLADDGTRSLVVWSGSSRGCFGRFVGRDGMPDGDVIAIATGTASGPNACFGDSCYLVVWQVGAYPALELYGSLLSRQGELIGDAIPIATGAECHRWAAAAHDGENFLVVWMTGENNLPTTIYGQFIGDDGSPIGTKFAICGNEPQQRWWPALAYSDSNCIVTWEQGTSRDIYGNVDIVVTGIVEGPVEPAESRSQDQTILSGHMPTLARVYDAFGRLVTRPEPGVYFRRPGPGRQFTKTLLLR